MVVSELVFKDFPLKSLILREVNETISPVWKVISLAFSPQKHILMDHPSWSSELSAISIILLFFSPPALSLIVSRSERSRITPMTLIQVPLGRPDIALIWVNFTSGGAIDPSSSALSISASVPKLIQKSF